MAAQEVTPLTPAEEDAYRRWLRASRITDAEQPDAYYDYRGLFKELKGAPVPVTTDRHFPDTYKQHGHPTFSVESKYSRGPTDGGRWEGDRYVAQAQQAMPDRIIEIPGVGNVAFPGSMSEAQIAEQAARLYQTRPRIVPTGQERNRADTNMVGVDHERIQQGIADWASKLPPSLQQPAARTGTYFADVLASLLELASAPENVVMAGARPAMAAMDRIATVQLPIRGAVSKGLEVAGTALDNPLVGSISAETANLGRGLKVAGAIVKPKNGSVVRVPGFDRYMPNVSVSEGTAAPAATPVDVAPAPAPAAAPGGARTLNDAMREWQEAEAAKRAQAAAPPTSPGRSARGGTAPRAGRPPSGATPESPTDPPTSAPPANSARPGPGKPKLSWTEAQDLRSLTPAEGEAYRKLRVSGKTHDEARDAIFAMRQLSGKLPTDADVRNAVQKKNARTRPPRKE